MGSLLRGMKNAAILLSVTTMLEAKEKTHATPKRYLGTAGRPTPNFSFPRDEQGKLLRGYLATADLHACTVKRQDTMTHTAEEAAAAARTLPVLRQQERDCR